MHEIATFIKHLSGRGSVPPNSPSNAECVSTPHIHQNYTPMIEHGFKPLLTLYVLIIVHFVLGNSYNNISVADRDLSISGCSITSSSL